jgi:hypothetical protein
LPAADSNNDVTLDGGIPSDDKKGDDVIMTKGSKAAPATAALSELSGSIPIGPESP